VNKPNRDRISGVLEPRQKSLLKGRGLAELEFVLVLTKKTKVNEAAAPEKKKPKCNETLPHPVSMPVISKSKNNQMIPLRRTTTDYVQSSTACQRQALLQTKSGVSSQYSTRSIGGTELLRVKCESREDLDRWVHCLCHAISEIKLPAFGEHVGSN
jgi:hypothetical protein